MATNLFAHVLRNSIPEPDSGPSVALRQSERRWVFRDLVVRRDGFAPWSLSTPASAQIRPAEPAAESVWAETQPCWRE